MLNKAGKTLTIFVVLIIILLVCSTSIGFYLYHTEERLHKKVQADLDTSRAETNKLQVQLAVAQDKNKEDGQLINNLKDEQDANEKIKERMRKEIVDLKAQMAGVDGDKQKMKADLDDSTTKLSQYQGLLKAADDKGKELEDRLAGLSETNRNMQEKIDGLQQQLSTSPQPSAPATPPSQGSQNRVDLGQIVVTPKSGPSGHILSVDTDADFVIFNLGLNEGLKPDDILSVYRGNTYLGDIKAIRVQDEMSAADIIPPLSSGRIRKNDTVVLKP